MESFEIYFSDLNEDAQKSLLDFVGVESAADMNWDNDILPITTFDIEYRGLPYGENTTICGEDGCDGCLYQHRTDIEVCEAEAKRKGFDFESYRV